MMHLRADWIHEIHSSVKFRIFCLSHHLSKNIKIKICNTIISPIVLYGYENKSLTQSKEHKVRVSESKLLRRTFVSMREEVIGR
jgi:hypothetical protein